MGLTYALGLEEDGVFASKVGRGTLATLRQYCSEGRYRSGLAPLAASVVARGGRFNPEAILLVQSELLAPRTPWDRWCPRFSEVVELMATTALCRRIEELTGCGLIYGDACTRGASVEECRKGGEHDNPSRRERGFGVAMTEWA